MRRLAVLVSMVVLFGGLGATAASAQTADAVSVARALIAAENAHNVPAAVALFAPGAIVVHATGQLASIAEITDWQRELAAGNFHAEITTPVAITPEVVTFSGNVSLDSFRSLGISTLDATWQLTVALGRVTTFSFDFTPASTARLLAAIAGAGATTTPAAAATTAGAGSSSGSGGSAGSTTAAAATAAPATPARALALTGADLGTAALGGFAVLLGLVLLGVARRPGASQG